MDMAVPFPCNDRARQQPASPLVECICQRSDLSVGSRRSNPFQEPQGHRVQVTQCIGLEMVGNHCKQKVDYSEAIHLVLAYRVFIPGLCLAISKETSNVSRALAGEVQGKTDRIGHFWRAVELHPW